MGTQHSRIAEERKILVFWFNYLHGSEGREGYGFMNILVAKCHMIKCVFAHVVPQKGVDLQNCAVERRKRDVLWLRHTKVILKTDNEQAIGAVLRRMSFSPKLLEFGEACFYKLPVRGPCGRTPPRREAVQLARKVTAGLPQALIGTVMEHGLCC